MLKIFIVYFFVSFNQAVQRRQHTLIRFKNCNKNDF